MAENIDKIVHQNNINSVAKAMKAQYGGDEKRVTRFVRVYTLSKTIGELEKLPDEFQETLELSALVSDIDGDNKIPRIKEILRSCAVDDEKAIRVCHIVENKHDYDHISGLDHQILLEAEMIVKFKENATPEDEIVRIANERFITNYGKLFLKKAFGV